MSLPQPTQPQPLGADPIRPLQSSTSLDSRPLVPTSIPPLGSSSTESDRTSSHRPPNPDEIHRTTLASSSAQSTQGISSASTPTSTSNPPTLTSSSTTLSRSSSTVQTQSSSKDSSSTISGHIVTPSSQSPPASSAAPTSSSVGSVESQESAPTPNSAKATIYASYNPSDFYANVFTSSVSVPVESVQSGPKSQIKNDPKTTIIVVGSLAGGLFMLMFVLLVFVRIRDKRKMNDGEKELLEPTYGATISANPSGQQRAPRRQQAIPMHRQIPANRPRRHAPRA